MANINAYKSTCKKCKSEAYYYPAKLLLEMVTSAEGPEDLTPRIVDIECTGEDTGDKHTCQYNFPKDFVKI